MSDFKASNSAIAHIGLQVLSAMEISGEQFYLMVQELDNLEQTLQGQSADIAAREILRVLPAVINVCENFKFPAIVDTIQQYLNQSENGVAISSGAIQAVSRIIRSSFQNRYFVAVDMKEMNDLMGDNSMLYDIYSRFPLTRLDIQEAINCLFMRRHTASVFHIMRALELVVREVGNELNVTVKNKHDKFLTWGVIVGNIGGALCKFKDKPEENEWREAHTYLTSVNIAFRTKTAHPERNYTPQEATDALRNSLSFMNKVKGLFVESQSEASE